MALNNQHLSHRASGDQESGIGLAEWFRLRVSYVAKILAGAGVRGWGRGQGLGSSADLSGDEGSASKVPNSLTWLVGTVCWWEASISLHWAA